MNALQLTAKVEHDCTKCRKAIRVGETMVRNEGRESNCSESYTTQKYYHLECWKHRKGRCTK